MAAMERIWSSDGQNPPVLSNARSAKEATMGDKSPKNKEKRKPKKKA
jgi:hypothetical protein